MITTALTQDTSGLSLGKQLHTLCTSCAHCDGVYDSQDLSMDTPHELTFLPMCLPQGLADSLTGGTHTSRFILLIVIQVCGFTLVFSDFISTVFFAWIASVHMESTNIMLKLFLCTENSQNLSSCQNP